VRLNVTPDTLTFQTLPIFIRNSVPQYHE